ncbi:MAG: hypothetical protein U1A77_05590 [Pirellulales bacterium]
MSNQFNNPYAAPEQVVPAIIADPQSQFSGGVWRQGKILVMHRSAVLPPRCVKTNAPADGRLKRKLFWHHQAIYLALLVNVIVYAVLASILGQRATIEIGLSEAGFAKRRRVMWIAWLGVLASIAMFCISVSLDWETVAAAPFLLGGAVFGFLGFLIYGLIAARLVHVQKMDAHYIWLKGVHPEYLDMLPVWPYA